MITFPLIAQAVTDAKEVVGKTTTGFAKLQLYAEEPWFLATLITVSVAVLAFVIYMYRRDSVELRPGIGWLLLGLRIAAFLAILIFFLKPEQRTEKEVVHNSRVLLLVDTSISMGLSDSDSSGVPATPNRIDQVVSCLADGTLISDLRKVHDVVVVRFDSASNKVATLQKIQAIPGLTPEATPGTAEDAPTKKEGEQAAEFDWKGALLAQGTETRLGNALKRLIDEERNNPVSAIVVMTDGGQNAGIEPAAAAEVAKAADIPIFTIGLGSDKRPINARVVEVRAPSRAYPNDAFSITGYVQGQGMSDRPVDVELYSRDASDKVGPGELEESVRVTLGVDGSAAVPVKFDLKAQEVGRKTYRVQVVNAGDDHNPSDNHEEADVEVVDRKTNVLLFASGATREYRFLRNQLARDTEVTVDTFLQNAVDGVSQDGNEVLNNFPATKEELYKYDTIIAIDPNWEDLGEAEIELVEKWVGEEAGGLIVIAGPIYTDYWSRNEQMKLVRDLYPVEFEGRFSAASDSDVASDMPFPLEFTPQGLNAEFLWLGDSSEVSQESWESFPGVYSNYPIRGAKPGATVYARFADPDARTSDEYPVYFAGHLYGSGRVFYEGSGEMWRTREIDDTFFEQLYTKLVRFVSQGRLLRGSSQGFLVVDEEKYLLGATVMVRAQLSDAQHEPLELAKVSVTVTQPDGTLQTVELAPDATRKGLYLGQFTAMQEGIVRLDLTHPEAPDDVLTKRFAVRVPELERDNPQRNDALLSEIAKTTGGLYYIGLDAAVGGEGSKPLTEKLRDRKETTKLSGAPNRDFEQNLMRWMLGIITGLLCLEWLIRRLSRLA